MAANPGLVVRRYEMGLTRAEFLRLLPVAIQGDWCPIPDGASGSWSGIEYRVRVAERPERRIAQLAVPVLEVSLEFCTDRAEAVERFIARFLGAYQRAGG